MTEQFYDRRGVPISKGDLVRSFHFIGARRKIHYLYHTVVDEGGVLYMVPTCWLEPTFQDGGKAQLKFMATEMQAEVIHGFGPEPYLSYEERPRKKK